MQDKDDLRREMEEVKNQPFARYEIDEKAERELKDKVRFGDPLKLIKSSTLKSTINQ